MCSLVKSYSQPSWTQLQDFPTSAGGRTLSSSFVINNQVFYVAGLSGTGPKSENWAYNTLSNSWEQKIIPQFLSRWNAVAFVINGKGYFGSGNLAPSKVGTPIAANDFYEYDPVQDTWTIKNAIGPTGRYGAVGFSINNKGYVGLGANSTISHLPFNYIGSLVKDILEYDPISGLWTNSVPNTGAYGAINAQVFIIKAKAYISGGFVPVSDIDPALNNDGVTIRNTKEFDPSNGILVSKGAMPAAGRHYAVAFSALDRGYIVGGNFAPATTGPGFTTIESNTASETYKYNSNTDIWTTESNTNPIGAFARAASSSNACYGYVSLGARASTGYNYSNYRFEGTTDDTYLTGSSSVCSTFDAQFNLQLSDIGTVTWSTSPNIYIVSGQGTKVVNVRSNSSSNGNGWVQASINLGCRVITFPQKTVWVGAPPANNSTLIWTTIRGENPITVGTGSFISYQVDYVPYADSYTWTFPPGFIVYGGSKTTSSPYISATTGNQTGTFTLYCRANNACRYSYTKSLTINVTSDGGGGIQMRMAFPNPANETITVKIKEEDGNEEAQVRLFNKNLEKVFFTHTKEKEITISTVDLPNGLYYLNVKMGKEVTQKQVIISH